MKKSNNKNCIICQKGFRVKPSYLNSIVTCSKQCSSKNKSKTMTGRKILWKDKIGKANTISLLGHKNSEKQKEVARKNWLGLNNPRWNGGIKKSYRIRKLEAEGSHTKAEWENLKRRYNNMCLCCKNFEPSVKLSEDHIVPLSLGGTDFISNIQPLCLSCNKIKGAKEINFSKLYSLSREYEITVSNT